MSDSARQRLRFQKSFSYSIARLLLLGVSQLLLVPFILRWTSAAEFGVFTVYNAISVGAVSAVGWFVLASVRIFGEHFHKQELDELQTLADRLRAAALYYSVLLLPVFVLLYHFYGKHYL